MRELSTVCRRLAHVEMRMAVANMLYTFDMELVEPEHD